MKTILYLLLISIVILFVTTGCEKKNENKKPLAVSGTLIRNSDCKGPDSLSCAEYSFNESSNTLNLKHVNAGFNCCPDSIHCDVTARADTLIILESEEAQLCNCSCLYDLDIEINSIEAKAYVIKFIEPYSDTQEPLLFEVDFSRQTEGSYCVSRHNYPWRK